MSVFTYAASLLTLVLAYRLLLKVQESGRQWLLWLPVGLFVLLAGTANAAFGAGDEGTLLSGIGGACCGTVLALWLNADLERRLRQ